MKLEKKKINVSCKECKAKYEIIIADGVALPACRECGNELKKKEGKNASSNDKR